MGYGIGMIMNIAHFVIRKLQFSMFTGMVRAMSVAEDLNYWNVATEKIKMGKRSSFPRIKKDFYLSPYKAVIPLLNHLPDSVRYEEPCCGKDDLVNHLKLFGHICIKKGDIITGQDALDIEHTQADYFITNPPWKWQILNLLIIHLSNIQKTWLLLNADVMHNKRMSKHMKYCQKIVSVGRVSWMGNSVNGYENCAWFLFNQKCKHKTIFIPRI